MSKFFNIIDEKRETKRKNIYFFMLRFLAELSEKGVQSIKKSDLSEYLSYAIRDFRNKGFNEKVYPDEMTSIVNDVVNKIPQPYFVKSIALTDDTNLVLNAENLKKHKEVCVPLTGERQKRLERVVSDWIVYKREEDSRIDKSISGLNIYRVFPNDKYSISIEDPFRLSLFEPLSMDYYLYLSRLASQVLITDGEVESTLVSDSHTFYKEIIKDHRGTPIFPGTHRSISLTGANAAIIQEYKGSELVSADLYTVVEGKELDKFRALALTPKVGERYINSAPFVNRIIEKKK